MKAALLALGCLTIGAPTGAEIPPETTAAAATQSNLSVEGGWTAQAHKSDSPELQLNVSAHKGSTFGTPIKVADLEGLSPAALKGSNRPVTFALRRESGTIIFTGRFDAGSGRGTLRFQLDPAYLAKIAAMRVENDWNRQRFDLLSLPMVDLRTSEIAALRREGATGTLSDFLGMRVLNVRPEMVREVRALVPGKLAAHDLMSLAALGVTPDYARDMRRAYPRLSATELGSLKALAVTADYVMSMRAAGARIDTAADAQGFRALGISPEAVEHAIALGRRNPTPADVMEARFRN